MDITTFILSLTATAGLGGVVGAFFQTKFAQKSKIEEKQFELKQKRYLCILMLMLAKLNPETSIEKIRQYRPDLRNIEELDEELKGELLNSIVFSNNEVLENFSAFIKNPSNDYFVRVASVIRKDLWGKTSALSSDVKEILKSV